MKARQNRPRARARRYAYPVSPDKPFIPPAYRQVVLDRGRFSSTRTSMSTILQARAILHHSELPTDSCAVFVGAGRSRNHPQSNPTPK
jgi:hypothetical protein